MKKEFYKDWKKKTRIEERAIESLKAARKIILKNIPKGEIISIYVKGSFVRREMNKKSDIDTVTILKTSKYLPKLEKLEKKYRYNFKPELQIVGYSLWELKTGKKTKYRSKNTPSSSRAVKHLSEYKLIYGNDISKDKFFMRGNKEDLEGMIKGFRRIFLQNYRKNKMGFSEIVKQVFWLMENEQKFLGKSPPHSWKKLVGSIKDKRNIAHDALKMRLYPTKDKKIRDKFIVKLKKCLDEMEKRLK